MMHGREKSDSAIVAGKLANKAIPTAAEPVEQMAGTKGNANQQSMSRAQNRATMSPYYPAGLCLYGQGSQTHSKLPSRLWLIMQLHQTRDSGATVPCSHTAIERSPLLKAGPKQTTGRPIVVFVRAVLFVSHFQRQKESAAAGAQRLVGGEF